MSHQPYAGEVVDAYALTPLQSGMLYHILAEPSSDVYMAYVSMDISGQIDVGKLQQAWHAVYQRHDALRSAFVWDGLAEPLQVVHEHVQLAWHTDTIPLENVGERRKVLDSAIARERLRPFNVAEAPLTRMRLLRWSANASTLIWVVHHMLADDWSTPLVLRDVLAHYNGAQAGLPAAFRFADHVHWLSQRDNQRALNHWRQYLANCTTSPIACPPANTVTATGQDTGSNQYMDHADGKIDSQTTALVTDFCTQHRVTLSTVAHGLWAILLSAYSHSDNPLFGSSVTGRLNEQANIDQAVGLFLNTLPATANVADTCPIHTWLQTLQQQLQFNLQFEYSALSDIQTLIHRNQGEALFESVVVVESHGQDLQVGDEKNALEFENIDYLTISNFPLTLLVFPGESLAVRLAYDKRRFTPSLVRRIQADLEWLFNHLAKAGQQLQNASPALIHRQLLSTHLEQACAVGNTPVNSTFSNTVDWFEHTCSLSPDAIAVADSNGTLTFAALDEKANHLAAAIQREPVTAGAIVGLCIRRSCDQVIGLLGIMKAGCAYLPIDPDYPASRIAHLLDDSGVSHVVTNADAEPALLGVLSTMPTGSTAHAVATLMVDHSRIDQAGSSSGSCANRKRIDTNAQDLAYVLYTSGSTGSAKGVCITHANLVYSTTARIAYYEKPDPVFLMLSSISFDSSVAGLFWCLCGGGTLVLPAPGQEKDMHALGTLLDATGADTTLCLPSLYRVMLEHISAQQRGSLTDIIVAGEACTAATVEAHQRLQPGARLHNEYGPTEGTVWSTVHTTSKEDVEGAVPIGQPIGDSQIAVLDSKLQPCPAGIEGEIYIGGRGVAQGYLQSESETAKRFISNPHSNHCPAISTIATGTAIDSTGEHSPGSTHQSRPGSGHMHAAPVLYRTGDVGYWREDHKLMFTGRADRQLKIRGYRVEPAEIEQAILTHSGVGNVVVVSSEDVHDTPASINPDNPESITRALLQMTEAEAGELLDRVEQLEQD